MVQGVVRHRGGGSLDKFEVEEGQRWVPTKEEVNSQNGRLSIRKRGTNFGSGVRSVGLEFLVAQTVVSETKVCRREKVTQQQRMVLVARMM